MSTHCRVYTPRSPSGRRAIVLAAAVAACIAASLILGTPATVSTAAAAEGRGGHGERDDGRAGHGRGNGDEPGRDRTAEGRDIFRYDTFGDEQNWTDRLRMHEVIEQAVDPLT